WLGRRQIPGIDAGRSINVWGRISCHDGRRLIYNPKYELLEAAAG
ncbi:MAG TPA: DNA-binding protein, partial [Microlunatus sp.]